MKHQLFELDLEDMNEIKSYLIKNPDKNQDLARLGSHDSQRRDYYLYEGCGVVLHHKGIEIHGKDKELINLKFSRLVELSKDYELKKINSA